MKKNTANKAIDARESFSRWRFALVVLLLLAMAILLLWNVASLQVVEKDQSFLQEQGDARTIREEVLVAHRGVITDRNGEPLAVSTPLTSLWLNPKQWSYDAAEQKQLADLLPLSEQELSKKLAAHSGKQFMYLQRYMEPHSAAKILAKRWSGVYGSTEYRRFYPAGEVTAHLVGLTNNAGVGQEGLELAFEDWLKGESGAKRVVKDLKGHVVKEIGLISSPKAGDDIQLSIDLRMQYVAHRELRRAVTEHKAAAGSVVLLDVATGEVLAMANQPSFNPNDRSNLKVEALRNRAIIDQFEPGSTMKPLTIMTALESGRYTPQTMIDTSPGYIRVSQKTLLDPVNYGKIDLTKIITKSSQVGISKIALTLEQESVRDMYYRLGLGQSTGTGFPGESVGVLPNKSRWSDIERANFAFGYGLSVSTLQLAKAYAVIASHGIKKDVSLLSKAGSEIIGQRVVAAEITDQIIAMLKTVPQKGGTGKRAQIADYPVAGKTGTIHKVGGSGYSDGQYLSVFAGMAPADDPRIVAVVIVDDPKSGKYYGGEVAAPVFSRVAEAALRLMNVPPKSIPLKSAARQDDVVAPRGPVS